MLSNNFRASGQRGSVSLEWTALTLVCCAALFLPVFDGGHSALGLLVEALKNWNQHSSLALSLP
jgi:hypothetical protein